MIVAVAARVRWISPGPRIVDEELVVDESGEAVLAVRTSRDGSPAIGTWRTSVGREDLSLLAGIDREIDLRHPALDDVAALAERFARAAREEPMATATFYAAVVPGIGIALQAVGGGTASAAFELDPGSVIIHLETADGTELGWRSADPLPAGFVSPEPEGLGGVGRPAEIGPGAYGTIALSCPSLDAGLGGADQIAVEVAGRLRESVTEDGYVRPFSVRTAAAPIPR